MWLQAGLLLYRGRSYRREKVRAAGNNLWRVHGSTAFPLQRIAEPAAKELAIFSDYILLQGTESTKRTATWWRLMGR